MATTPAPFSPGNLPIGPTVDVWRTMTAAARESFLISVLDALSDPRDAMSEGRPHKKAKARALDMLGRHFKAMGRVVYLAEEMAVVYPGEPSFSPDLLAVVGVEEPEDDERLAWVVADEGKGLDVVLEVLHLGNRDKDLVTNVERYGHLGIPEYFIYDHGQQQIHGYRLPTAGAQRYTRIVPQAGRYTSTVLGIDLAIQGGRLRFFEGMAELFGTDDLIGRLTGMMAGLEGKAEQALAQAEQARALAEQALLGIRQAIVALLVARGIPCDEAVRARVFACEDAETLQRWLLRATAVSTVAQVFEG